MRRRRFWSIGNIGRVILATWACLFVAGLLHSLAEPNGRLDTAVFARSWLLLERDRAGVGFRCDKTVLYLDIDSDTVVDARGFPYDLSARFFDPASFVRKDILVAAGASAFGALQARDIISAAPKATGRKVRYFVAALAAGVSGYAAGALAGKQIGPGCRAQADYFSTKGDVVERVFYHSLKLALFEIGARRQSGNSISVTGCEIPGLADPSGLRCKQNAPLDRSLKIADFKTALVDWAAQLAESERWHHLGKALALQSLAAFSAQQGGQRGYFDLLFETHGIPMGEDEKIDVSALTPAHREAILDALLLELEDARGVFVTDISDTKLLSADDGAAMALSVLMLCLALGMILSERRASARADERAKSRLAPEDFVS